MVKLISITTNRDFNMKSLNVILQIRKAWYIPLYTSDINMATLVTHHFPFDSNNNCSE